MTTTTISPTCTVPAQLTVHLDPHDTYALTDGTVTIHRYATKNAARKAAALHAHPDACHTCLHGCDCDITVPTDGCGHFGCWGQSASLTEACAFVPVIVRA